MTINIYLIKPSSLLSLCVILIIVNRGIVFLFSYLICSINLQKIMESELKFYYFIIYVYIIIIISLYNSEDRS